MYSTDEAYKYSTVLSYADADCKNGPMYIAVSTNSNLNQTSKISKLQRGVEAVIRLRWLDGAGARLLLFVTNVEQRQASFKRGRDLHMACLNDERVCLRGRDAL